MFFLVFFKIVFFNRFFDFRLILFFVFLFLFFKGQKIKKEIFFYFFSYIVTAVLFIFPILFNQSLDFRLITLTLTRLLLSASIYLIIFKTNITIKSIVNIMLAGFIFQLAIGVLGLTSFAFRELLFSIEAATPLSISDASANSLRLIGLGGIKFFGAGIYYGAGAIFIFGYFVSQKKYLKAWICLFFIISSGIFFARTTLIALPFCVFLYILITKRIKTPLLFLLFFIAAIFIIHLEYKDNDLYRWAFEPVVNLIEQGELKTQSTDVLYEMYGMPSETRTYIIGDGHFVKYNSLGIEIGYYRDTDVGYLRLLHYGGFFLMLFYFLPNIYSLIVF